MIRAHMATFPARAAIIETAVAEICVQVDQVFLVMNEYDAVPETIANNPKVTAIIPDEDFKDVGKFVFKPNDDDIVLLVDDDIKYPDNYVEISVKRARNLGLGDNVFGYHCSIYHDELTKGANSRQVLHMRRRQGQFVYVDQIGTGTLIALGKNIAPLEYMRGSQKFVDVRYAKWLHEHGINSVVLKRPRHYIKERFSENPEDVSIYDSFTQNSPEHVIDEIKSFAGKSPLIGKEFGNV